MYNIIATLDDLGAVKGLKYVGASCEETIDDIKLTRWDVDILDTEYDETTGEFRNKDGEVKYKEKSKPKIKDGKKDKIEKEKNP